jgi:tRNA threonylcarbamoyladenosine biosynthesis protein TsaB
LSHRSARREHDIVTTILCIDTASDRFALAIEQDGRIESLQAEANQDHSRLLLPAIAGLVGERPLEAILVITGPGAYAGIRVGIATAEGLALARGIALYGIGTLEAAALAAGQGDGAVIHPAGRGEFASQRWESGQPVGAPVIASPASLAWTKPVGEGAGALGGREIGALERAEAALRNRAPLIRSGALAAGAEAFYLREPSITVSRRQSAAAS